MRMSSHTRSKELHERARKVMPGGNARAIVWRSPHPIYAASGKGAYLTDVDGNRYLDLLNNWFTLIHGHARPEVVDAIAAQAARGTCFSMPTESEIELAELLSGRVTSIEEVRFASSGTEAVMFALKGTRAATGRPMIAKCEGAYHGSYEPVEVSFETDPSRWGNRPARTAYSKGTPERMLADVVVIPFNRTEESLAILGEHAKDLAAIIVDPMPSRIGPIQARREYLQALRAFCDRNGSLLVFDEVACFRAGYSGMQGIIGVEPDLTTLGKIIGGGLPVGAVGGKRSAMRVFDPSRGRPDAPQSGTFTANPMTMAAGHAAMQLMTPEAYGHLAALGAELAKGITGVIAETGAKAQIVGYASAQRIHMSRRELIDYRSSHVTPDEQARSADFCRRLLAKGFIIAPNGAIALSTAMTKADIADFVSAAGEAFREQEAAGLTAA